MNTMVQKASTRPAELAVACAMALVARHKLFGTALREAADHRAVAEQVSVPRDWASASQQLAFAMDDAMHSISALHAAAVSQQPAIKADPQTRCAQRALSLLTGVLQLHEPLREAVRLCGVENQTPSTGTWPRMWADLTFELDEMHAQATAAIESVRISAREEVEQAAAKEKVYGDGERDFEVMMTLQTTAHRFIHVRAGDAAEARETALNAARDEQGAHFVLNEGNFVSTDDLHTNAVFDDSGNEIWNDDQGDLVSPGAAPA